jgi:hypothetical protein
MDDIIYRCSAAIKQAKHDMANNIREELTPVSKIGGEFSFLNNPMGVYGSLPFDSLHALTLGLMEYMLKGVFSHVAPPRKVVIWCEKGYKSNIRERKTYRPTEHNLTESMVKTYQAEFERRITIDKDIKTRQNDHDIPKTPFNNGFTFPMQLVIVK